MWMEVKPVIERTRNEVEASEVDYEAERGDDGEPDVAQGADGTGSEVARLLGPPLVLGEPEPAWGSRAASDARRWRCAAYGRVERPGWVCSQCPRASTRAVSRARSGRGQCD